MRKILKTIGETALTVLLLIMACYAVGFFTAVGFFSAANDIVAVAIVDKDKWGGE